MSGIGPGDVVVCVAGSCGGVHTPSPGDRSRLTIGRVYTVTRVILPRWAGGCKGGVHLAEIYNDLESGFCIGRFRKIDRADEEFIETVRACKPIEVDA